MKIRFLFQLALYAAPALLGYPLLAQSVADGAGGNDQIEHLGRRARGGDVKALQQLEVKCRNGQFKGCAILGELYLQGGGVERDIARALSYFKKGCAGNFPPACIGEAKMIAGGIGAAKDQAQADLLYKKAFNLLQTACSKNNLMACTTLGGMYVSGNGVAIDYARAVPLLQKACAGGHLFGCYQLGQRYATGEGVPQDYLKAVSLYQKACDGGTPDGCLSLAVMYSTGRGVAMNSASSALMYQRACDGGLGRACYDLGMMFASGQGVAKDPTQQKALTQRACKLGHQEACRKSAETESEGKK